ncbi:hypothetical protein C3L33_20943, partial [Rhododendron williamsianum]
YIYLVRQLEVQVSNMGKTSTSSEPSTHADRKFEKKLEFYAISVEKLPLPNSVYGLCSFSEVRDTVASLGVQKAISKNKKVRSRKKKLKAYDLSTLSEFLPDLKAPRQPPEFKLNSKSRQNLVLKEGNQLKTVLNHPDFQSDPFAAIHQHLQSTQPVTDEKPARKKTKGGKTKSKKKKPRTSSGPQSMES